ncbi:putative RNA methyltransferase [Umbelopsis sp. PMI_123]|nr:putative RNA methyltransferase [Umbelopsis sp. PMI_123]
MQQSHVSSKKVILRPRKYTVSLAIPSGILDTAPTQELKTVLAGQIGRMLAIYNVDEVIIYDEKARNAFAASEDNAHTGSGSSNLFLARVLQYLETPQYLRKALVPISKDLRFAALLSPLDSPHHPQLDERTKYREGVTVAKPVKEGRGSWVDVGLRNQIQIDRVLKPKVRVTVEMGDGADNKSKTVSPKTPREVLGLYWGYTIRLAGSFSRVLTESPHKDGYDLTVGVTDRDSEPLSEQTDKMKQFSHMLIAFGGPNGGLQNAIDADEDLQCAGEDANELFDIFITPSATAGSRTIRTEEGIPMVMTSLQHHIEKHGKVDKV